MHANSVDLNGHTQTKETYQLLELMAGIDQMAIYNKKIQF